MWFLLNYYASEVSEMHKAVSRPVLEQIFGSSNKCLAGCSVPGWLFSSEGVCKSRAVPTSVYTYYEDSSTVEFHLHNTGLCCVVTETNRVYTFNCITVLTKNDTPPPDDKDLKLWAMLKVSRLPNWTFLTVNIVSVITIKSNLPIDCNIKIKFKLFCSTWKLLEFMFNIEAL